VAQNHRAEHSDAPKNDPRLQSAKQVNSKGSLVIIVSDYNSAITHKLMDGAIGTLTSAGISQDQIQIEHVPGAWELPLAALRSLKQSEVDAVMVFGCVIKGETTHDEHINRAVSTSLMDLSLRFEKPVGFGLLTVNTLAQAEARAGGSVGNKGEETAQAVLAMLRP
jgi:6,7-dimethyl-8-ribityllumazine synthase